MFRHLDATILVFNILNNRKLLAYTEDNCLRCKHPVNSALFTLKLGHSYYAWGFEAFYIDFELEKSHLHFSYLSMLSFHKFMNQRSSSDTEAP